MTASATVDIVLSSCPAPVLEPDHPLCGQAGTDSDSSESHTQERQPLCDLSQCGDDGSTVPDCDDFLSG